MDIVHLSIRALHVLLGVVWAGATFLIVLFLEPTVREAGPAGGRVMSGMVKRGYSKFIGIVALLTVLTGLWLLWRFSGHFSSGFMGSRAGILLSTGMLTGFLALGTGVHMVRRSVEKLAALGETLAAAARPPSPEEQAEMLRLQGKVRTATRLTAVLLLISVITMALGPHV